MIMFSQGWEWYQGCRLACVIYDGDDDGFPLDWSSRCEWIVPGTIELESERELADQEWRTDIENAPKDGGDVLFPIELVGRAYWCSDLKRWVLAYPLHMEYVPHPARFRLPRPDAVRQ